ncbi:AAA family ATPase [Alienimonas californiensis]|uniref:Glutamine ABC transporter ATP-binding protein n=1 Tax=Alienimonas californiensis TaxID=2527989 RepID=A0A517P6V7_9PLAN|nr:AAA family ATPase [Alienimonas californiensis]QDT15105.1 glutamine ABC transporter ATP-binding protein [Alienimonas californiensis]
MRITVSHPLRPRRRSLNTARVAASFGLDVDPTDRLTVAENLPVEAGPGRITLFTGPSGSGKSTLLRAAADRLEADGRPVVRADDLALPDRPLADALPLGFDAACALLSKCGLAEPRLLLRTPAELSEGQRFRFRLALAVCLARLSDEPGAVVCDEFAAVLDRTLAAAVAHNVRRLCAATGVGFLLATTHEDLAADLAPHHAVRCRSAGPPRSDAAEFEEHERPLAGRRRLGPLFADDDLDGRISFAGDLFLTTASRGDWPAFADWHYRAHTVGIVRFGVMLWHGSQPGVRNASDESPHEAEPVGIALFCSPPLSLRGRNQYFGSGARWTSAGLKAMNAQLVTLARVVLHPTYRGCSLAAPFVAAACDACPFPWVESLTQLGQTHPFLERAGFVKAPVDPPAKRGSRPNDLRQHSAIYGAGGRGKKKGTLSAASHAKSRYAAPAYFIRDNRSAPAVLEANRRDRRRQELEACDD